MRATAFIAAAAVFALDRVSKWLIGREVGDADTHHIIPGFFDIVHSENRGVAFGILNDSPSEWRTAFLVALSLGAVIFVATMLWKPERLDRLSRWGLALVLGGAAGNLFDRAIWGSVTDFLEVYYREYHWPTFNVADSAIVIGSGLLLIDLLRSKQQAPNVS
jgi:signal peptidase II